MNVMAGLAGLGWLRLAATGCGWLRLAGELAGLANQPAHPVKTPANMNMSILVFHLLMFSRKTQGGKPVQGDG